MSEIISKAQQAVAIHADTSIEPWRRVVQALKALSGLSLSDLSTPAKQVIEANLAAVNNVTAAYEIVTFDDYKGIDDADLEEILERIQAATAAAIDSEVERVMSGLREAKHKIPKHEIEEVRQHTDIFVPLLMEAVERAVTAAREDRKPEGKTHFFAVFLLTELEVDEAFPLLLEGFKLPGERAFDLFGDAVHELLPRALALFARNDIDKMDELLRDLNNDMYVRWAAATAYKLMVRDGTITRDVAVAKLEAQLKWCIAEKDCDLPAGIVCELSDLAAEESLETIKASYELGLANESIVDFEFVKARIAQRDETLRKTLEHCRPTGVPDTIAELSHWASFREQPEKPTHRPKIHQPQSLPRSPVPAPNHLASEMNPLEPVGTLRLGHAKVGRNDPCPCGSGKKFKKCCR